MAKKVSKKAKGFLRAGTEIRMEEFTLPHQHGEKRNIQNMHKELSDIQHFTAVAEIFKQLGDLTRVRIFWFLCHREECVINIAAMMDMSSPAVSHHLRSMNECGLISSRRDGKEVYYKAADTEESKLLHKVVEQIMEISCPKETVDHHASLEDIIHSIHEYLMEHLSERITIEELARKFLINTTTLKKAFKDIYGISIAAHMKEHRMERAAELLQGTQDSIAQIALAVGYESQSRFTTAFKETYGVLPTEYRKGSSLNRSTGLYYH